MVLDHRRIVDGSSSDVIDPLSRSAAFTLARSISMMMKKKADGLSARLHTVETQFSKPGLRRAE
jgi:hypothetical protein